jgi:hypothetical protein
MSPGGMASEKEDLIQNWLMLPSVAAGSARGERIRRDGRSRARRAFS